tara:strand:- start:8288 stop:8422 length:135 start_codon:yes stop_codon:yes gene_type:complete
MADRSKITTKVKPKLINLPNLDLLKQALKNIRYGALDKRRIRKK